jgi:GTP cyclohydrolase II
MYEAERGLFDLRRGRFLYVTAPDGPASDRAVLLATVEGLNRDTLDGLRRVGRGPVRLAVTHHRARAMGLTLEERRQGVPGDREERRQGVPGDTEERRQGVPGDIDRPRGMSLSLNGETPDQILRLSSATGSWTADTHDLREASAPEIGGLTLARLGNLLPAVVSAGADPADAPELRSLIESRAVLSATTDQIEAMAANVRVELTYVGDGPVPLADAEDARILCFREANGLLEHVAIVIGTPESWPDPVPVRLHSACLTGDLFGSLRCDCGEQLRGSLRVFAASGGGVLLYLAQEGRGIGLGNKLRAYLLQQEGLDTIDADATLGFGADERRYHAGIEILRHLGIQRIQLLTNNPDKVRALREGGIEVTDRRPLFGTLNRHNLPYVTAKVQRAGHWLDEMLAGAHRGK